MADSVIGRRKKARGLLRSTSALRKGVTAGQFGESPTSEGEAIKQLNSEANEIQGSDPKLADDLRRQALQIARERRKR